MIVAVAFGLTMAVRSYLRYRGKRVITCPETANHAAVHVNVVNAAREAAFGKHHIRLDQSSRWPERQNCGQECPSQIEAHPKGCMVWHSTIGTRARPVPIARSPSMKSTGMTANPLFLARTATPRSGAKFRRKICPPFFRISFLCAGNQPAATKRAQKVALGATPFKLPNPHQSLVTR
jgi:hypothetical protein